MSGDPSYNLNATDAASAFLGGAGKLGARLLKGSKAADRSSSWTTLSFAGQKSLSIAEKRSSLSDNGNLFLDKMIFMVANRKGYGKTTNPGQTFFEISDQVIQGAAALEAEGGELRDHVIDLMVGVENDIWNVIINSNINLSNSQDQKLLQHLLDNINWRDDEENK
jgi:hypothetical protein